MDIAYGTLYVPSTGKYVTTTYVHIMVDDSLHVCIFRDGDLTKAVSYNAGLVNNAVREGVAYNGHPVFGNVFYSYAHGWILGGKIKEPYYSTHDEEIGYYRVLEFPTLQNKTVVCPELLGGGSTKELTLKGSEYARDDNVDRVNFLTCGSNFCGLYVPEPGSDDTDEFLVGCAVFRYDKYDRVSRYTGPLNSLVTSLEFVGGNKNVSLRRTEPVKYCGRDGNPVVFTQNYVYLTRYARLRLVDYVMDLQSVKSHSAKMEYTFEERVFHVTLSAVYGIDHEFIDDSVLGVYDSKYADDEDLAHSTYKHGSCKLEYDSARRMWRLYKGNKAVGKIKSSINKVKSVRLYPINTSKYRNQYVTVSKISVDAGSRYTDSGQHVKYGFVGMTDWQEGVSGTHVAIGAVWL